MASTATHWPKIHCTSHAYSPHVFCFPCRLRGYHDEGPSTARAREMCPDREWRAVFEAEGSLQIRKIEGLSQNVQVIRPVRSTFHVRCERSMSYFRTRNVSLHRSMFLLAN